MKNINNKFIIFIYVFSTFMLTSSFYKFPHITGDGHEYYMMTQSFYSHGTPNMIKKDMLEAYKNKKKHKMLAPLYNNKSEKLGGYFTSDNGNLYSYHFFFYSLLNVPIKYILVAFNYNDFKSFQILNIFMFIVMIFFVYKKINYSEEKKIYILLLLIFNPVLFYIDWTHPEVFTYIFVVISLTYFYGNRYKLSYLFMSIASLQNPPVIVFSFLSFLYNTIDNIKHKNYKEMILQGFSLSISAIPSIFYLYYFKVPNLIASNGFSDIKYVSISRIYDLYFGLSHGMILFYPFILFYLFYFTCKKLFSQDAINYIYVISIAIMCIAMATTSNWNSGMSYIIRYSIWLYPFIVFYIFNYLNTRKIKILSIINTIYFIFIFIFYNNFSILKFNYISNVVLSNYPSLYFTDKETFAENILHKDGVFDNNITPYLPIYYENKNNAITKILTDKKSIDKIIYNSNFHILNPKIYETIQHKNIDNSNLFFINVPKNGIVQKKWCWSADKLPTIVGKRLNKCLQSEYNKKGVLSFGPYIALSKGKYKFKIEYISSIQNNLSNGAWDLTIDMKPIMYGKINGTNNINSSITKTFEITDESVNSSIEIRTFFNGTGKLILTKLTIEKIDI